MDETPFATSLKRLTRKHDTIGVRVTDPMEIEFPSLGLIDFRDPETGKVMTLDTSSPVFRRSYSGFLRGYQERIDQELKKAKIDMVSITNGEDFVQPLANYFKKRNRR